MTHGNNNGNNFAREQPHQGVIRVGRKGRKRFAFGDDGEPFEVDVVVAFQAWVWIDEQYRERSEDRSVLLADMPDYHRAAVDFVTALSADHPSSAGTSHKADTPSISTAEALDFIARLREQYDEVAAFFHPRSREERDSPDTSEVELQFSAEES